MSVVLHVDAVSRAYGSRRVLTAATVQVSASEIVGLLGRNGCGKTTLLRIACGALRAHGGNIRLFGERVARPRLHLLARQGVFFLPERGLLSPMGTVESHFARLAACWGVDVTDAIDRFRVADLLDRLPAQLSTGERRRVEFALATARAPRCLLADEPFLGMAPRDAERLAEALRALARDGCAILMTGHEVRAILDLVDSVTWMTAGTTHALGPPRAAVENHSFRVDYLGPGRLYRPADRSSGV